MTDEMKLQNAKRAYATLCRSLDADDWNYDKKEDVLVVKYNETGKDFTMSCTIMIDVKRQVVRFQSILPISAPKDKIVETAAACCFVNSRIAYGGFDLDPTDGMVTYRITYAFHGCTLGEDFFREMRCYATTVVDKYNDKFVDLALGKIKATDFADM
jgi:hypothetical protein